MSATELVLSPEQAARAIHAGEFQGPARVRGRLEVKVAQLPTGLHCYDLDCRGSELIELPDDLRVDNRLILDDCPRLRSLPQGLTVGALSLRNCIALGSLPEGLSTWFLDLTGCLQFDTWPERGTLHNGSLVLRNCASLRRLPAWLGRLSHLDLAGCAQITEVPEGVEVSGWVDVGGSGLAGLPASLARVQLRWRGVRVDQRVAFQPETLTAREALAEANAELRRVMIERMGYLRFAQEANPTVLDDDLDAGGPRQLLKIDLNEDEPLVGLACACPSTGRRYLIRVPPKTLTCHQAAAWIAGFDDPALYHPNVET